MFNDAPYYIDLIQLIASLVSQDKERFSQVYIFKLGEYKLNKLQSSKRIQVFAGSEQAEKLLLNFSIGENFLRNELGINPLTYDIKFNYKILEKLTNIPIYYEFAEEGSLLPPDYSVYLNITTCEFIESILAETIRRICGFQTGIASAQREQIELTNHEAKFINIGSHKAYSTTAGAYWARAFVIGGGQRFVEPQAEKFKTIPSENYRDAIGFTDWNVKSNMIMERYNRKNLLAEVGYQEYIIENLYNSGIFALKEEEYYLNHLQGFALSGTVLNEVYDLSDVDWLLKEVDKSRGNGFLLIDSLYQSIYNTIPIEPMALYGREGKAIPNCLSKYKDCPITRAKRTKIPKIRIENWDQIIEIVSNVKKEFSDKIILFRGQGKHYIVKRSSTVNEFLYGNKDVDELSLITSASRHGFEFDDFFAKFQLQLQGFIYSELNRKSFIKSLSKWEMNEMQPLCPINDQRVSELYQSWKDLYEHFEWDVIVMGLAQHYGIPTHGLDVTDDLVIATWFALNEFYSYNKNGHLKYWYRPRNRKGGTIEELPVIYVIASEPYLKTQLDMIEKLGINAVRPKNQHAYLQYGGWGFHTNQCAQDVVAALFLDSSFIPPKLPSIKTIFPNTKKDPFYKQLLQLKKRALTKDMKFGYDQIIEYASPNPTFRM